MQHLEEAVQDAVDGNRDPIQVYLIIRDLQDMLKKQIEILEPEVAEELLKFPNATVNHSGWQLSSQDRKFYDFKDVQEIKDLSEEINTWKRRLKFGDWVDPETGEVHHRVPYKSKTIITRKKAANGRGI